MTINGKNFKSTRLVKNIDSQPLQVKYHHLFAEDISEGFYPLEIFIAVLSFEIYGSYKEKIFFINKNKDSILVVFANTTKNSIILSKGDIRLFNKNIDRLLLSVNYEPYSINFEHESLLNIVNKQLDSAISLLPRVQDKKEDQNNNIIIGVSIVAIFLINSSFIVPYIKSIVKDYTTTIATLESKKTAITTKLSEANKKLLLKKTLNIKLGYKATLNYANEFKKYSIKNKKLPKSYTIKEGEIVFND
jgi:hypothetical protein